MSLLSAILGGGEDWDLDDRSRPIQIDHVLVELEDCCSEHAARVAAASHVVKHDPAAVLELGLEADDGLVILNVFENLIRLDPTRIRAANRVAQLVETLDLGHHDCERVQRIVLGGHTARATDGWVEVVVLVLRTHPHLVLLNLAVSHTTGTAATAAAQSIGHVCGCWARENRLCWGGFLVLQ